MAASIAWIGVAVALLPSLGAPAAAIGWAASATVTVIFLGRATARHSGAAVARSAGPPIVAGLVAAGTGWLGHRGRGRDGRRGYPGRRRGRGAAARRAAAAARLRAQRHPRPHDVGDRQLHRQDGGARTAGRRGALTVRRLASRAPRPGLPGHRPAEGRDHLALALPGGQPGVLPDAAARRSRRSSPRPRTPTAYGAYTRAPSSDAPRERQAGDGDPGVHASARTGSPSPRWRGGSMAPSPRIRLIALLRDPVDAGALGPPDGRARVRRDRGRSGTPSVSSWIDPSSTAPGATRPRRTPTWWAASTAGSSRATSSTSTPSSSWWRGRRSSTATPPPSCGASASTSASSPTRPARPGERFYPSGEPRRARRCGGRPPPLPRAARVAADAPRRASTRTPSSSGSACGTRSRTPPPESADPAVAGRPARALRRGHRAARRPTHGPSPGPAGRERPARLGAVRARRRRRATRGGA